MGTADALTTTRLKRALDIPSYTVRPPCPPRIYNKLYKYFHQVLEVKFSRPRAARVSNGEDLVPASSRKRSRPSSNETRISELKNRQQQLQDEPSVETHVPDSMTPLVERLCAEIMDATAARHVLAGVNAVLTSSPPRPPKDAETPTETLKGKTAALAIAVCFYVQARIHGGQAAAKDLTAKRKAAVEIANNSPDKWNGDEMTKDEDVERWMQELHSRGWLRLPWFTDIDSEFTSRSTTGSDHGDDSLGQQDRSLGSAGHEEQDDDDDDDDDSEPLRPTRKRQRPLPNSSQRQSWRKEIVEPGLNTMVCISDSPSTSRFLSRSLSPRVSFLR